MIWVGSMHTSPKMIRKIEVVDRGMVSIVNSRRHAFVNTAIVDIALKITSL